MRRTLNKLADDLIREARAPFTAEDFLRRIQARWGRKISASTLDRLKKNLPQHQGLIGMESDDFLPCRAVLEKMGHIPLAVPLSPLELQEQILIPGCRLIPLLSGELSEDRLTFLDGRGNKIPKRQQTFLLEEVFDFYRYSNEQHFPEPIKINEWIPGKSSLTVTVWNMREVFADFHCRPGDSLLAELADYGRGVFRLRPYPAGLERRHRLKMRSLHVRLEEMLIHLSRRYDFSSDSMEKQLLRAFYNLQAADLQVPAFSLNRFLDFLEKLSVVGSEWGYPRFMPAGKFKRWELSLELAPKKLAGRCNSLNQILEDLGMPFDAAEFRAILRSTIARNDDMELLVDLLFGGKGDLFCNKKQETAFYRLLRKMMTALHQEVESPELRIVSELRRKTVQVKLGLIRILKILEVNDLDLADLPLDLLDQVIDLDSFCVETLYFLEEHGRPMDLKTIRDIQQAHKIIGPKLAALEEDVLYELGID
ncbi:MAG: hypothetical protein ACE5G9_01970 [Nitrospinales bacterium]